MSGDWKMTGAYRFRPRGWLFHRYAVLQVQEVQDQWRPKYTGHTPDNWRKGYRWRDATFAEALAHGTIDEIGHGQARR